MINRGKLVTFFVVFMILSSGIIDVYAKSLSLDEAVQIALKNNPQLLMLRRSVSSSESAIRAKELSRYGEIYIQGGFKKTGEDFIVFPMYKEAFGSSSGLPFDDEYFYYNLTYNIPIYTGGKISESINLSKLQREVRTLNVKVFENNLVFKVKEIYLRILSIDKKLDSVRSGIEAVESVIQHISQGIAVGKFAEIDLLKAEAKLEGFLKVRVQLESERERLYNSLLYLMGEKNTTKYSLVSLNPDCVMNLKKTNLQLVLNRALKNRSDLRVLKSQIDSIGAKLRIKKAEKKPQIIFSVGYNGTHAEGIDFERSYYQATVNVRMPIFTFGRIDHEYDSVRKEQDALVKNLEYKMMEIRKEIMDAWSRAKMVLAQIKSLETQLKLARRVEEIERLKYINGRGKIDDLLMAIANTVDAEAGLFNARVTLCIVHEDIARASEGGF